MKSRAAVLLLALLTSGCGYNRIQELDEQVEQMRGNIDTELQRRADLVPNLVRTVDEAASFEQETQTRIAEARSGLNNAQRELAQQLQTGDASMAEVSEANAALSRQLSMFINVAVEAYPDLQSNQNFMRLQDELTETENRLNVARRDYNEVVATHNTYIRRFPQVLTAKVIGADRKDPFTAAEGTEAAPQVEFNRE